MAIEKVFPKAPSDVIYVVISLMQKWSHLLRGKDKERVDYSGECLVLDEELLPKCYFTFRYLRSVILQ
jgi:hypothetical protein